MEMLEQSKFEKLKREKLLSFETYEMNFVEASFAFDIVKQSLEQPQDILDNISPYDLMVSTKQRAWEAVNHLVNCYSAGHDIFEIASIYPSVLEYWEVYSNFSKRFKELNPSAPSTVAHLALQGNDFVFANRLVSLGILLGWGELLPRIQPIIDYNNPVRDGMIERLLSSFVPDRGVPPADCTRHLPYFKTIKIFDAAANTRAVLLANYLNEWYPASRREPYYESHKKGSSFLGYWAWEAAAIAVVLDVDDTSFRDAEFYPADMVTYAKKLVGQRAENPHSKYVELRVKAGERCPKRGDWKTLDIPSETVSYVEGDVMKGSTSPYGITVWMYIYDSEH